MISIVCRTLAEAERPVALVNQLPEAVDLRRASHALVGSDPEAQIALWAAVVATQMHGAWARFDLRSRGARGRLYMLPKHWRLQTEEELRRGFLHLVHADFMTGEIHGLRFTDEGVTKLIAA